MLHSGQGLPGFFIVCIGEFNLAARLQAFVGFAGGAAVDPDAVGGDIAKFIFNSVFNSAARAKQQDEHEYAPGNTESGQQGPELVGLDCAVDFLQVIEKKCHRVFMGLTAVHHPD